MDKILKLLSTKLIPSFEAAEKLIDGLNLGSKVVTDISKRMVRDALDEEILGKYPVYARRFAADEWKQAPSNSFSIGGMVFRVNNITFTLNRLYGSGKEQMDPTYDAIDEKGKLWVEVDGGFIKGKIKRED